MNTLWSLTKCLLPNTIPFWTGWNSLRITEANPKQVVCYMDHIQLPPTRLDVVMETLKRSQAVARECVEQYSTALMTLQWLRLLSKFNFRRHQSLMFLLCSDRFTVSYHFFFLRKNY